MFILDLNKLELGDVILQAGDTKFSGWIKFGTKSDYSHAMVYVGNSIIHALTDGVYSANPQRIIVESKVDLIVLRYKNQLNTKQATIITDFARNITGSLYNIPEAGASLILGKTKKDAITSDQFCSRLVAQAYRHAGISIVANPDYCSPADIHKSAHLHEVSDVTREALDNEVEFANSPDPTKENQRRTFEWLNKARDTFSQKGVKIQTENNVQEALMHHSDLDEEISGYVKASGYLTHYAYDKEVNPHRYSLQRFLAHSGGIESALDLFYKELNKEPNEITRHSTSYFRSGLNFAHLGLEYSKLHNELYKNLLSLSLERLTVLGQFARIIQQPKLIEICDFQAEYVKKLI